MGAVSRMAALMRRGSIIAIAMGVMNVSTYAYQLVVARLIGTAHFGAFTAVLSLLLVVSVVSLGLQATAARRIAADPEHVAQIEAQVLRVTWRTSLALGFVLMLLSPVINHVLRLDSLLLALMVPLCAVPLTMMGGQAGTLQGERRWTALALVYVAAGVPRIVLGTGLVLWRPTELWALVGVFIGYCAPVLVGWWALRHQRAPGRASAEHRGIAILRESVHNSQALFAFFALSSVDIIVARNVLSEQDSSLYAAGLILTKAVLFLPQFVIVLAFPSMSSDAERRRALALSLGLVAVLGTLGTLASSLLSGLAMIFVGGGQFAEIESRLWIFALLGTALSMLQLLVYAVLARQGRRTIYLVWMALVVMVGGGLTTDSVVGLVTVVVVVDLCVLAALLAASVYLTRVGHRDPETVSTHQG
ncbi:polysaccharide biosynthesis protein [Nocardioides gansuensis]|uniref:Polysaccharide biosynthesis protein n=1 Tax=Nocardioides gansuensis TaxID=2138300 RepID=A0A2T8FD73_9ACTN|nr:polysaccharide biosynthesis protein [Nocardioides gansuensis]PVG83661.1 polysaccharide biosynthesis protein [Nocardioides gansuensis]